jgi:hypothetical protein
LIGLSLIADLAGAPSGEPYVQQQFSSFLGGILLVMPRAAIAAQIRLQAITSLSPNGWALRRKTPANR